MSQRVGPAASELSGQILFTASLQQSLPHLSLHTFPGCLPTLAQTLRIRPTPASDNVHLCKAC